MKTKNHNFLTKIAAVFCAAVLTLLPVTPVLAVDVQMLPVSSQGASGFTHGALVTYSDLDNSDASALVLPLFLIPTNSYIDRVAYYVEEQFTNALYVATGGGTNLVLTIGVGGTTNAFFGSNTLAYARTCLATNMLIPYKATTSTNYLIACFSDALQASEVDGYTRGRVRIFWRLVQPSRYKF